MLRTAVSAPNATQQPILLADVEVPSVASPPQLLTSEECGNDEPNGGKHGQDGVVPSETIQAKEKARDTAGGRFGLDLGWVFGNFVDGFENGGAAGTNGFAGDGGVPIAAVLWGLSMR